MTRIVAHRVIATGAVSLFALALAACGSSSSDDEGTASSSASVAGASSSGSVAGASSSGSVADASETGSVATASEGGAQQPPTEAELKARMSEITPDVAGIDTQKLIDCMAKGLVEKMSDEGLIVLMNETELDSSDLSPADQQTLIDVSTQCATEAATG